MAPMFSTVFLLGYVLAMGQGVSDRPASPADSPRAATSEALTTIDSCKGIATEHPVRVWINILVSPQGTAQKVEIKGSSNNSCIDQAVSKWFMQFSFTPAVSKGKAIGSNVSAVLEFSRNEKGELGVGFGPADDMGNPLKTGNEEQASQKKIPARPIEVSDPIFPNVKVGETVPAYVMVHVFVGKDGLPKRVNVDEPGNPNFDEAAMKAAKAYRFSPAMQNGKAVEDDTYVKFRFAQP